MEILGAVISGVACWAESGSATRVALRGYFLSQCTIHIVIGLAPPTRRQGPAAALFFFGLAQIALVASPGGAFNTFRNTCEERMCRKARYRFSQ